MRYWIGTLLLLLSGYNLATELVVYTWEYYLAPEVKNRFEQETGIHIKEVNYDSDEARNRLLSGGYPPEFDIVSIDSLSLKDPVWKDLYIPMPEVITKQNTAIDPTFTENCGKLSVPYMWGSIGIAYRQSQVTKPITRWQQLFEPEPGLSGRIVMVDDTFDLISVALKAAGYSINTHSKTELQAAYNLLQKQRSFVAAYQLSFAAAADGNVGKKIAAAMVYSGDFYVLQQNSPYKDWVYVVPEEGSPLWLDCMAILKTSQHQQEAEQFLAFLTRPDIAVINGKAMGFTPALQKTYLPTSIVNNAVSYPPNPQLQRSEFYDADVSGDSLRSAIYFAVLK
nr:spermidine/putrescine ABC transporter substrate-binding protein [uncultured Tolumonas sp.]